MTELVGISRFLYGFVRYFYVFYCLFEGKNGDINDLLRFFIIEVGVGFSFNGIKMVLELGWNLVNWRNGVILEGKVV